MRISRKRNVVLVFDCRPLSCSWQAAEPPRERCVGRGIMSSDDAPRGRAHVAANEAGKDHWNTGEKSARHGKAHVAANEAGKDHWNSGPEPEKHGKAHVAANEAGKDHWNSGAEPDKPHGKVHIQTEATKDHWNSLPEEKPHGRVHIQADAAKDHWNSLPEPPPPSAGGRRHIHGNAAGKDHLGADAGDTVDFGEGDGARARRYIANAQKNAANATPVVLPKKPHHT